MSRRRRRSSIGEQFSARRRDMLESPAYRALSLSAHRVIDRVCLEHMYQGGAENGRLIVTYDDFERYGIHRHAIGPAIREAIALGFLEITKQGRAGNAEWRSAHHYRITFHPSNEGTGDGSHEWRRVSEEDAPALAAAARKNKTPVVENANSQCGLRHRKGQSHSAVSATTETGTESATTFYISGRGAA